MSKYDALTPYVVEATTTGKKGKSHKKAVVAVTAKLDLNSMFSDFAERYCEEVARRTAAETRLELLQGAAATINQEAIEAEWKEATV